jgi:hypothetical protein
MAVVKLKSQERSDLGFASWTIPHKLGKEEKTKHVENFCFAGCSKRLRGKARENRAAERT